MEILKDIIIIIAVFGTIFVLVHSPVQKLFKYIQEFLNYHK